MAISILITLALLDLDTHYANNSTRATQSLSQANYLYLGYRYQDTIIDQHWIVPGGVNSAYTWIGINRIVEQFG